MFAWPVGFLDDLAPSKCYDVYQFKLIARTPDSGIRHMAQCSLILRKKYSFIKKKCSQRMVDMGILKPPSK